MAELLDSKESSNPKPKQSAIPMHFAFGPTKRATAPGGITEGEIKAHRSSSEEDEN